MSAQPSEEETLQHLATLSPLEYDRAKKSAAEDLDVTLKALDLEIKSRRKESKDTTTRGRAMTFYEPEPWPEPVDGGQVLTEAADHIFRHMRIKEGDAFACVVWAAHTHMFECFNHTPRLCITAGAEECGKTVLMNHMVGNLVNKPLPVELMKPAPFFRIAEEHRPTYLIDECDIFIKEDSELIAAINSGWEPHGGVPRCVGDDHEPRIFSTHTPMAMAGIQLDKKLPATTIGRSIVISLERAIIGEIEIYNQKLHQHGIRGTGRKIARFIADNRSAISNCNPTLPNGVQHRLADKWTVLFAIAEIAGCEWRNKIAMALHSQVNLTEPSKALQLLMDIKSVLPAVGHMATVFLIDKLCRLDDSPWEEYNFSRWDAEKKKIHSRQIANLLGQFGLKSKTLNVAGTSKRGYQRDHLENAFNRYIPSCGAPIPDLNVTTQLPAPCKALSDSADVTSPTEVTDRNALKPAPHNESYAVTGKLGASLEKERYVFDGD
jgi:putative DNA primase/helicase